jgi:polyisoprenoid-binding protein YceI
MTRTRLPLVAAALILAIGLGGYLAYDQVLSGDSVAPLALATPAPDATVDASPSNAAASSQTGASDEPVTGADGDVAGTWTVTEGSQAGYRVREQLASLSAESDAVGRTSDITGSITVESDGTTTTVTGGSLLVDTTTITSDEDRRDDRLRTEGLQTDSFPTATFVLTQPVDVPAAAVTGTISDLTLVGDLTLHGVTQAVSIPAQAQVVDGTIQVQGSITFPLADYDIVAPNIGGFIISIADEGTLEFLVTLAKS